MPNWIDIGGSPVYVDEYGVPQEPPYGEVPPSETDPFLETAPQPGAAPAPASPSPASVSPLAAAEVAGGAGASVSASGEQFDEPTYQRASTGFANVDAEMPGIEAKNYGEASRTGEAYRGIAQRRAQAQADATEAQAAQFDAKSMGDQAISQLQNRFALAELEAQKVAMAEAQKYRAGFEQELATYRAMDVDPGRLWSNMSGGQRFGTMVSAFVTDFLATRGVNTSAMKSLNTAIERDIDAQIQNISKQGQVTDQFKTLWDMSVREGATEAEFRTRVNAYYLAGAEKAVMSTVTKYDSVLARANGAAAISAIQEEYQNKLVSLQDMAYTRAQAELDRRLDTEKFKQGLAVQKWATSISARGQALDEKKYDDAKRAAEAATAAPPRPESLKYEVKSPFTGETKGVAINEAAWKLQNESAQFSSEFADALDNYLLLAEKQGAVYDGPGGKYVRDTDDAQLVAARELVRWAYVKAMSGKAVTKGEMAQSEHIVPLDSLLKNGTIDKILEQTGENVVNAWEKSFNQNVRTELTPDEQAFIKNYTPGNEAADYRAHYAEGARGRREKDKVDVALETLRKSEGKQTTDRDAIKDWHAAGNKATTPAGSMAEAARGNKSKQVPKYVEAMSEIYSTAIKSGTSPQERDAALKALYYEMTDPNGDPSRKAMAEYYLNKAADELADEDVEMPGAGPEESARGYSQSRESSDPIGGPSYDRRVD